MPSKSGCRLLPLFALALCIARSNPETDLKRLIYAEEAARVLRTDAVTVQTPDSGVPGAQAVHYFAKNHDSLYVAFFFEKGKEMFAFETIGKDDPQHYGNKEPCTDIGDSCYRPNQSVLVVLKGSVCFNLSTNTSFATPIDRTARDELAKKIADRLY